MSGVGGVSANSEGAQQRRRLDLTQVVCMGHDCALASLKWDLWIASIQPATEIDREMCSTSVGLPEVHPRGGRGQVAY